MIPVDLNNLVGLLADESADDELNKDATHSRMDYVMYDHASRVDRPSELYDM